MSASDISDLYRALPTVSPAELFSGRKPDEVFVTSHVTSLEVESVAARVLKGRVLDQRAYGVLLALFATDLEEHLIILPVQTTLISEAAEVARRYALKAADALHLATALRVKQPAAEDAVVVASDKELVRASRDDGFRVLDPEENGALGQLKSWRT